MAFFNNLPNSLRTIFDDGLDEVLIFAFIFIFILLSGTDSETTDNPGILPLIIIAAFLIIFVTVFRVEETVEN